jgi:hypothetical protein
VSALADVSDVAALALVAWQIWRDRRNPPAE